MPLRAYYNEIDPFAVAVLKRRIADGSLPPGDVDDRDIRTVQAADLRGYGKARLSGNVIWMRGFDEETRTQTQTVGGGGKGGSGGGRQRTTTVTYVYFCDVAVALCEGPITSIGKMFADGNAIGSEHYAARRVYLGDATQSADPLIAATEGLAPAYRGLAYVVLERFAITPFGNRLPNFSFELNT